MPRRRWRLRTRHEDLSESTIAFLTTHAFPLAADPEYDSLRFYRQLRPGSAELVTVWRDAGAEITTAWLRANPGSRPWAWWAVDAREPRWCVAGAELLAPKSAPSDFEWVWRQDWGVPAFIQARPRGYVGLPAVESQAAYLDRLGLLGIEERAELVADAFESEFVNPFVIDVEEIDRLLGRNPGGPTR
jgi:hypothetical protein